MCIRDRLFERPVVICLGLGTNQGDHAGNSSLSRYLSSLAVRRSRAAVSYTHLDVYKRQFYACGFRTSVHLVMKITFCDCKDSVFLLQSVKHLQIFLSLIHI